MPYTGGGYQTTAKAGSIRNNGATVLYAGNIAASSPVTQALGMTTVGFRSGNSGSIMKGPFVPTAGTYGARFYRNAVSGSYGVTTAGRYIIRRFTNYIAGNASTVLSSGASDFGRVPYPGRISNRIRTQRIITTGGWNHQTGKTIVNYGQGDFGDILAAEAFPTRAIPGKLTYRAAGKTLTRTNYPARSV